MRIAIVKLAANDTAAMTTDMVQARSRPVAMWHRELEVRE